MMFEKIIIDTDVCIKLGSSEKYFFLQQLTPQLSVTSYIHQCVYNEIMMTPSIKKQLHNLINDGFLKIVDDSNLTSSEKIVYNAIYRKLSKVMMNPKKPRKNKGETSSLAMAKIMNIPIFFSDESRLQEIVDRNLNTGIDDIKCVRIVDVIRMIKDEEIEGFTRKQAKAMWCMSGKNKEHFDKDIWAL